MKKEIVLKCSCCEAELSFNSRELKVEGWTEMHRITEDWKKFHMKNHQAKIYIVEGKI